MPPQTINVVQTRARALGLDIAVGDQASFQPDGSTFGVLVQYPDTLGEGVDYSDLAQRAHQAGALFIVAADLLSEAAERAQAALSAGQLPAVDGDRATLALGEGKAARLLLEGGAWRVDALE